MSAQKIWTCAGAQRSHYRSAKSCNNNSIINHMVLSHEVQLPQGSVLLAEAVLLHSSANVSASKTVLHSNSATMHP